MAGLKIKTRGGVCYAVGSVAGQRVRQSLGTRDPAIAEELRAQLEAKLWKRHSYGEEAVRTFDDAALSYQEAGGDSAYLAPIIKHFRGKLLGKIKPEDVREAARKIKPLAKASTRNRHVIVPARAVINHAAAKGWCSHIRVEAFPVAQPRRRSVDRDWLDAFVARADADGLPHLAACAMFMWQNGVRVSEAARVLPDHLELRKHVVVLGKTKTGEWRVRHITRELAIRIAKLTLVEGEPVFGYASRFGIRDRMIAVCRRAGIPFVPPHQAGRHSFATNSLDMGMTVKEVMEAGDFKSARLFLETYAHAEGAGKKIAALLDTNRAQRKSKRKQTIGRK